MCYPDKASALSKEQLARSLGLAAVIWLLLFYFAREIHYIGDDFTVLQPLFYGGIVESLHTYVRPLEYAIAYASLQMHFPIWLVASFLIYCATAVLTLILSNQLTDDRCASWWKIFLVTASPIAAEAYFQIDTVSQALAVLFALAFVIAVMQCLKMQDVRQIRRATWSLALLAALAALSKETSYGIVFLGSTLLLLRHRRVTFVPMLCVQLMLLALVGWSSFHTFTVTPGSHYGLKKNPLYWFFGLSFSTIVTVLPAPTSFLLTGTYRQNAITVSLTMLGAVVFALAILLFLIPTVARSFRATLSRLRNPFDHYTVLWLFLIFSTVPAVFFKTSELYASQQLPYVRALLVAVTVAAGSVPLRRFWIPCSLIWVSASAINLIFYSISSGFDPSKAPGRTGVGAAMYGGIQDAVNHQRFQYSVYSDNALFHNWPKGRCEFDTAHWKICLPLNISSGFPSRFAPPPARAEQDVSSKSDFIK